MEQREIKFRDFDLQTKQMRYFDIDMIAERKIDCPNQYGNIMQFTGLKDCNGKEIFEGDIVEITSGLCPSFKASVIYKNGLCRLESAKGVIAGTLNDYVISIIGNIHQTAEL